MATHIVVADDSLFARMLVKEAVGKLLPDAEYIESTSGEEVLAENKKQGDKINWYLLDINMGEPNGLLTAAELLDRGVDRKSIAIITGNKSRDVQSDAESKGLTYINKAVSPTDVPQFVDRLQAFFSA